MPPDQPVAVRTPTIIGRTDLLDAIRVAILGDARQALFFIGPGGIGKTRLLEEVETLMGALPERPLRQSGIIDLYHARHHSSDGLRRAVADGLDPENQFFVRYRTSWQAYHDLLAAGVGNERLDRLYREQEQQFLTDYAAMAATKRLVLCFDTVELIQYESDLVQHICQVQDDDTAIKNWFLQQATLLPNTVILFAGRPQARIQTELRRGFTTAQCHYAEHHLVTFTEAELQAYIQAVCAILPHEEQARLVAVLDAERLRWLFRKTGGRPIRLMLYLEFLRANNTPRWLNAPAATSQAEELRFEKDLFEFLRELPLASSDFTIEYLFRARKGLDLDLLRYLAGSTIPESELEPTLRHLTTFAFVKYRFEPTTTLTEAGAATGRSLRVFLHDELYDLFDRYFANQPNNRIDYLSYVEYYRERVAQATSSEREDLRLTLLHYELQHSPRNGFYGVFAPWNNEAIQAHAVSFDIRLRDEVLRFFNRYVQRGDHIGARFKRVSRSGSFIVRASSLHKVYQRAKTRTTRGNPFYDPAVAASISQAEVERDSAVRWVMRYFSRGKYPIALSIAETLYQSKNPSLDWAMVNDPLYKASLLTEWAVTMLLSGASEAACLPKLEAASSMLLDERHNDPSQMLVRSRIIGRAYTYIGYLHRTRGRYGKALTYYLKALPYFGTNVLPADRASTLTNLAYVQALLERVHAAREHINEALEIRQLLGHDYPFALSKNTLGRILTMQNRPDRGQQICEQALETFRQLGEWRGVGMALIGVGYALRKRADQWKEKECSLEDAELFFVRGARLLAEGAEIFVGREPLNEWEALNELGSLYCDWGWLAFKGLTGNDAERWHRARELYRMSEVEQRKALEIAVEKGYSVQVIDSLDDLSQVHGDLSVLLRAMGEVEGADQARAEADKELQQVFDAIPAVYKLVPGQPVTTDFDESSTQWRAMGKVHLQLSRRIFEDLQAGIVPAEAREAALDNATQEILIAAVYFKKYQQNSFAYDHTPLRLARRLRALNVTFTWADARIKAIESAYNEDLGLVREMLRDVLGI